jgi:DNA polymerase III delta prime subunit
MAPTIPTFISKYKPYFVKDFCADENVTGVIQTMIRIDFLNILFVGNSNSGKTTLLYAIIRDYYGLDKSSPLPEHNILFVNNLKEQGIQYFRNEMKTFCQSHSNIYGKKKLVIIDDIDNINEQSQQVFRNYIDKYKRNIHFIAVCNNIKKVIESIQSRMHILHIPSPSRDQITSTMERIILEEKLVVDDAAKQYLLLIANGSIRVMVNSLEKISILREPVDLESCKKICSNISLQYYESYVDALNRKDLSGAIDIFNSIYDYGYSVIDILDYFFNFVKITPLLDEETKYRIIPELCKYITIFHKIHEDSIELALFTNSIFHLFV